MRTALLTAGWTTPPDAAARTSAMILLILQLLTQLAHLLAELLDLLAEIAFIVRMRRDDAVAVAQAHHVIVAIHPAPHVVVVIATRTGPKVRVQRATLALA